MEYENNQKKFESVYSTKVRAGKRRTYFFDVRKTKGDDFYITLTESTKRFDNDGYERHKIFLYKEDFNRFLTSLGGAIDHVKTELMPDYDYDEFTRRQEEWEIKRAAMDAEALASGETGGFSPKPAVAAIVETAVQDTEAEKVVSAEDVPSTEVSEDATPSLNSEEEASPSMDSEEAVPLATPEEAPPSEISEETNTSTETDEEDMSW